jgi:hypothetical protein
MKRIVFIVGALFSCVSVSLAQQNSDVPDGWTKINICHIRFYLPPDMKKGDVHGIDSCVAQFANNELTLYLDYGFYGGRATTQGTELDWNEDSLSVDGKDGQLTTFVDASHGNSGLKYIAALFVVVKPGGPGRGPEFRSTTLMMSVTSDKRKDRDGALAIFRTIRLDDPSNR